MKKEMTGIAMVAAALMVGVISGCKTTSAKQVQSLESSAAKASSGFELVSTSVSNTLASLNVLQQEGTDLAVAYPAFRKQAQEVASLVERVKAGNEKLKEACTARFDSWKLELEGIQNESIKKESVKRMEDSLKKYDDLLKLLSETDTTLDPLVSDLTDIVKYLNLDLSQAGVKHLSNGIKNANKGGEKVQKWIGVVINEFASVK